MMKSIRFETNDWPACLYVSDDPPEPGCIEPVENRRNKPKTGGLWTSPQTEGVESAWTEWMRNEKWSMYDDPHAWELVPKDGVELFIVDSKPAAKELYEMGDGSASKDWRDDEVIDFEAVQHEYDGVRMTHEGQIDTRMMRPHGMYGWDCASTLWFDWVFEDVVDVGSVPKIDTR